MKKYLLLLLTMLTTTLGAWADSVISFGSYGSSIHYNISSYDWECWAKVEIKTGDEAAFYTLWTSTETDAQTFVTNFMNAAGSGRIQFGGQAATITLPSGGTISMQGGAGGGADNQSWQYNVNYTEPTTTINSSSSTELETWLTDATNGTKNQYLFNNMAPSKTTISGTDDPVFTFGSSSSTVTLKTIDSKLVGVLDLKGTDALSDWTGTTIGSGAFFSNLTYRININNGGTSYIDLGTNSATVHSASNTDFDTWLADNTTLMSSITSVTFEGEAKIETSTSDGTNNYIVINGTTATVTNKDNLASLLTWMNNTSRKYLSNVNIINFASETTYTIETGTTVTFDTSDNATVSGSLSAFNSWKAGDNAKKLLSNKTIVYNNVQLSDNDECYISLSADGTVATVHATTAKHFATLFGDNGYNTFPEGTTFKFDSESNIDLDDLKKLAGIESYQSNKYYVDLFDLTASTTLCDNSTGVIGEAISWMRTNDRQFKGLILPKNHKLYGSGTTLIQGETPKTAGQTSTCSEFIAYYKTQEMVNSTPTDLSNQLLVAHVYNASNSSTLAYNTSFSKMKSLLDAHTEVGTNTDIYSISTNSVSAIDISALSSASATRIEVINNEMVVAQPTGTKASMYAYTNNGGDFATAISATSLSATPTDLLQINGPFSPADITSLNALTDGPRVLDLKNVTSAITEEMLESIENSNIEYIILPASMATKAGVNNPSYSSKLTNLKAVIASSNTDCVAYIKQAGSLAEARCLATGGTGNPTPTGLVNVTLTGTLNAADIKANSSSYFVTSEGRWQNTGTGSDQLYVGLSSEQTTIKTIDLADAVFVNNEDMNFMKAGLTGITHVDLPTDDSMNSIPAMCFQTCQSLTDICIPFNYEYIHNAAFLNSDVKHITTTNSAGELIDNGDYTFTLSANIKELGDKPVSPNTTLGVTEYVFSTRTSADITDVYIMATDVPKCYANVFPANMCYANSGFKGGDFPYCREKYRNSSQWFVILRYPSKSSTDLSDADYLEMQKLYTDINKIYSMKEQSGAIDANGAPITWPTFSELIRVWNQATQSKTWNEWATAYNGLHEVNEAVSYDTGSYTKTHNADNAGDYDFSDYEGWHQFVLSQATYMETAGTTLEYVQTDRWYTFCFPFSITVDQLQEMLGVPASTETVKYKLYDKNGALIESASLGHKPEARTLNAVERKPGTSGESNQVIFNFTKPLVKDNQDTYFYWNINETTPASSDVAACGNTELNKVIALRGGLPYIIKPYLPKGVTVNNLGKYLMERFAHKFTEDQACGNLGTDFYEQLGTRNKVTSRFVKPYEKHKIQAFYDKGGNQSGYYTHSNGKKYYYAFIGQFWEQDLPQYALYMVGGKWYRYASGNKGYKLQPYKCVIICAPEDDGSTYSKNAGANSGKYRSEARSHFPIVTKVLENDDIFDSAFSLGFLNGLDDADFNEGTHSSREANYVFSLDEDIIEYDENGNQVTSIDNLDGEDLKPAISDGKIYNMAGQYVGESPEDLSKGMYIMNGRKFVVK